MNSWAVSFGRCYDIGEVGFEIIGTVSPIRVIERCKMLVNGGS